MGAQLDDITVFVEIVNQGSLRAAARCLGISPSAVSKRLAQLESRLELVLLERTTRRLHLTQAGEVYFARVAKIPALMATAKDEARELRGQVAGTLRVAMPSYFESARLHRELIPEYSRKYPKVRLDLQLVVDPLAHQGESFDVLIAGRLPHQRFPDSKLKHRRILNMRGGIFASPSYLKRAGRPRHPRELEGHNCLVHQSGVWWFVDRQGQDVFHQAQGNICTNSNSLVRAATASGLGISYSFPELFSDLVEEGSVEELLVDYTQKAFVEIHSFFPALRYTPVRTRAFVDALVNTFGRAATKPD